MNTTEIKLAQTPHRGPRNRLREMGCHLTQRGPAIFLVVPSNVRVEPDQIVGDKDVVRMDELPLL